MRSFSIRIRVVAVVVAVASYGLVIGSSTGLSSAAEHREVSCAPESARGRSESAVSLDGYRITLRTTSLRSGDSRQLFPTGLLVRYESKMIGSASFLATSDAALGVIPVSNLADHASTVSALCLAQFPNDPGPVALVAIFSISGNPYHDLELIPMSGGSLLEPMDRFVPGLTAMMLLESTRPSSVVLASPDGSFTGRFASIADSSGAEQLFLPVFYSNSVESAGRFVGFKNVSSESQYAPYILSDAKEQWSVFRSYLGSKTRDPLGVFAAWVGDECELGRCVGALSKLDHLPRSHRIMFPKWGYPNLGAYLKSLKGFLIQHHYMKA